MQAFSNQLAAEREVFGKAVSNMRQLVGAGLLSLKTVLDSEYRATQAWNNEGGLSKVLNGMNHTMRSILVPLIANGIKVESTVAGMIIVKEVHPVYEKAMQTGGGKCVAQLMKAFQLLQLAKTVDTAQVMYRNTDRRWTNDASIQADLLFAAANTAATPAGRKWAALNAIEKMRAQNEIKVIKTTPGAHDAQLASLSA